LNVPVRELPPTAPTDSQPKSQTKARATPKARPASGRSTPSSPAPRAAQTARPPAARPRPSTPPQLRRRTRRGQPFAFWILTGAVVSAMVLGLVAVHALSVNTTYRMQSVQAQVRHLSVRELQLSDLAATRSSPSRVAAWAAAQHLVAPDVGSTVVLAVRGTTGRRG
jgi:hypothetical protein